MKPMLIHYPCEYKTLIRVIIIFLLCLQSPPWPLVSGDHYPNPRLQHAATALRAWKSAITSDPKNITATWVGDGVCNYTGIFCAASPITNYTMVVAGVDLNGFDLAGTLPEQLGLLTDLALFHINSNRFQGSVPDSFRNLTLLFELDVSNNRLSGHFPSVVMLLPSLMFLDIRYNSFYGTLPAQLFDMKLDALFLNNNGFASGIPENLGDSPVSVVVFANNNLTGPLPASIGKMGSTLNEILFLGNSLTGCIPWEVGNLTELTVLDVGANALVGCLPDSIGGMKALEQLNVAHNDLSGAIPESICQLPRLKNFTYSHNYFCNEPPVCRNLPAYSDEQNCILYQPMQRSIQECATHPNTLHCTCVSCSSHGHHDHC